MPMKYEEIIYKLGALCSQSEYCCSDMLKKMERWEVDEKTQAEVMAYLIKERYIDEERFARAYIRNKLRFDKWGRRKIEQGLYLKKVPKETYQSLLAEVSDEEYIEVLEPLLDSKRKSIKAKSDYEMRGKLIRFAMGRGFDYEIIEKIIDKY